MRRCLGYAIILACLSVLVTLPANAEDDRLEIHAFVGQVINNFSADGRKDYVNPDEADDTEPDLVAGIDFEYELRKDLHLFGEFIHSSRVLEAPCEDSSSEDCDDPDAEDFFEIIEDSSVLEWLGGLRWATPLGGKRPYEFFVKAQAGFIRAEDAPDDVIDNHFVGIGVEHGDGKFEDSRIELGWGRTDLFSEDKRSERGKVGVVLNYRPDPDKGYTGFFFEGFLDSDFGPGSDDIQIYYGMFFDVDRIFSEVGG